MVELLLDTSKLKIAVFTNTFWRVKIIDYLLLQHFETRISKEDEVAKTCPSFSSNKII